jgi:hypothetical protein
MFCLPRIQRIVIVFGIATFDVTQRLSFQFLISLYFEINLGNHGKGKFIPVPQYHIMKAYMRRGNRAPRNSNSAFLASNVQLHAFRGRNCVYSLDRRLDEAHSQCGSTGEEKYPFPCQKSKHGHPTGSHTVYFLLLVAVIHLADINMAQIILLARQSQRIKAVPRLLGK